VEGKKTRRDELKGGQSGGEEPKSEKKKGFICPLGFWGEKPIPLNEKKRGKWEGEKKTTRKEQLYQGKEIGKGGPGK